MEQNTVLILLAAYNGEAYLRSMVDSVLAQDYPHIRVILSDDGSQDRTVEILDEYAAAYPQKIVHYRSGLRFGCAQAHFLHLLSQFHDAPYLMFCDQDDVWHPDKVRKTLDAMKKIETSVDLPAMVHTDLRVVDRDLKEISPSFCRQMTIDGTRLKFNQLLVHNVVTGCTMMINRSLAELACRSLPKGGVLMHDWWLALLASACGNVGFLNEPTIDYRQHGNNSVGAKNVRSFRYLWDRLRSRSMRQAMRNCARQARVFLDCYGEVLPPSAVCLCEALASTERKNLFARNQVYWKYKLYKKGFPRLMAQCLGL